MRSCCRVNACLRRRKMRVPPARAGGMAENRDIASGHLHCETGRSPARACAGAFRVSRAVAGASLYCKKGRPPARAGDIAL
jgi:hypothetical protein